MDRPAPSTQRGEFDVPRMVAVALVVAGHLALLLWIRVAMHTPADETAGAHQRVAISVELIAPDRPPPPIPAPPPRVTDLPRSRAAARTPSPARVERRTQAVFLDDAATSAESDPTDGTIRVRPDPDAGDMFGESDGKAFKGFPAQTLDRRGEAPTTAAIRLPDRPSMMRKYWAVPEGEDLKGRAARKVPLLGLLLSATGALGAPKCPPKSEHPDCLRELMDD